MSDFTPSEAWHPEDVLAALIDGHQAGQDVSLGVIVATEDGGVRRPGTLVGVIDDELIGYVSHGCVDRDVVAQAQEARAQGEVRKVLYGEGSSYTDIELPCAGSVAVVIDPHAELEDLCRVHDHLLSCQPVSFDASETGFAPKDGGPYRLLPKPHLCLAGRGGEALALVRLALSSRFKVTFFSPDAEALHAAESLGAAVRYLRHINDKPELPDDPFAAFVLLFHDHEWEQALLQQAVERPFFYIGALGSRRAQEQRRAMLSELGLAADTINRVRGPIGLIPKARDSAILAISALAEVAAAYEELAR